MVRAHRFACGSAYRLGIIVEHHTGQQTLGLYGIQRMLHRHLVDLGHMVAW